MPNKDKMMGNVDMFYTQEDGNIFGIAFDQIFNIPKLKLFNRFEMTSKRNFKNLSPNILETYNEIFLDEGGRLKENLEIVLFNILNAKNVITAEAPISYERFLEILDNILNSGDHNLKNEINEYVENNYIAYLDDITEITRSRKKKINDELVIKDDHARELLKLAYMYRILIPIISVYFTYSKEIFLKPHNVQINSDIDEEMLEDLELGEIYTSIFIHVFDYITGDQAENLKNKLYKLTYSRIVRTAFSDKRFWAKLKTLAMTKETETLEIYKKLITNSIPKLSIDPGLNIVSFIQAVINNQIDFIFKNKFKYQVMLLQTSDKDSVHDQENMSESEIIELNMARKDEGSHLIRKLNIDETLKQITEDFDVGVEDFEVKHYMQFTKRDTIKEQLISMLVFKYFRDSSSLKFLNYYQFCYLLIACKKYLVKNKFDYLPVILDCRCEKHKERITITGKKIRPQILESKWYNDLFLSKFVDFREYIEGPLLSFIATVYSSTFVDEDGEDVMDGGNTVADVAFELINVTMLV